MLAIRGLLPREFCVFWGLGESYKVVTKALLGDIGIDYILHQGLIRTTQAPMLCIETYSSQTLLTTQEP